MTIDILLLNEPFDNLEGRLNAMREAQKLPFFAPDLLKLTGDFAQRLLNDKDARQLPELQALGFWLRDAAIEKIKKDFNTSPNTIAVPQGVVFHIPPSNVATMFAYSLFMSLLCGNANIVRLPSNQPRAMTLIVRLLGESFAAAPMVLRDQLLILSYNHNDAITTMLSRAADLRVVWGGDETVAKIRAIASAPFTRELLFPDRFSWSLIDANAYANCDKKARGELAAHYFNDLFWFDQNGCSSPRIVLWHGKHDEALAHDFYGRVADVAAQKRWQLDEGGNVLRQTRQFEAMADIALSARHTFGALTVFTLEDLSPIAELRSKACFGGTLFECWIEKLTDVVSIITRRDQTLAQFGFSPQAIDAFAQKLNGRGFDRIVRIGAALSFDSVWDGYDLSRQFTRLMRTG